MLHVLASRLGRSLHRMQRLFARPRSGGATVASGSQRARGGDEQRKRARLMKRDLYELLQQHPPSRRLMRHLDCVERTLRSGGIAAVEALPARVLQRALAQLEGLVWDWSSVGLAELRSRIAVQIKCKLAAGETSPDSDADAPQALAEFDAAQRADVSEVEHAMYEEMERSWIGQIPEAASRPVQRAA
jgi:hypothetical protein